MTAKITASEAMLKTMEAWGINHIFGLPGGSFDSTMNALHERKDTMKYIQVRHEEVGALAAVGEQKVTGQIGACFGSAGPGAVHLLNGLYDAREDHTPVLALVGQVGTWAMNTNFFQEMPEDPVFNDVAVYERTVMTAQSLPQVVDDAIREAITKKGPAVVVIPTSLGWEEIDDNFVPTASSYDLDVSYEDNESPKFAKKIDDTLDLIKQAKRPMIYFGNGARDAGPDIVKLSNKLGIPMMSSVLAKGVVNDDEEAYMGPAGRLAGKPGVDLVETADFILFLGSNYEFGQFFWDHNAKFVQVDTNPAMFGHRHHNDISFFADSKKVVDALLDKAEQVSEPTNYYKAAVENKKNWDKWVASFDTDAQTPLRPEPVFNLINKYADDNAIFNMDVGNVSVDCVRYLKMKPTQNTLISAWYATMGCGLPYAIGNQVADPTRQNWAIAGDGGFSMIMQDVITAVKYKLPIINVVLSNETLGFIQAEQDDHPQPRMGVDLQDADYGKAAEAMGAKGYTVTTLDELKAAFADIKNVHDKPIVIDVKITSDRPVPVEQMKLDSKVFGQEAVDKFNKTYGTQDLIPFRKTLEKYGL